MIYLTIVLYCGSVYKIIFIYLRNARKRQQKTQEKYLFCIDMSRVLLYNPLAAYGIERR